MEKQIKHILISIVIFLSSFIYFFLAYIGFTKQNIDLNSCNKTVGIIADKGIDKHYGSKGRKSDVFFIRLENMAMKLGVYRMSRNYEDLLQKTNIGDLVTVYYIGRYNKKENVNIDLIQVEKAGHILIDKSEYERKESVLIYIGLAAGIFSVILAVLHYRRKNPNRINRYNDTDLI